MEDLSRNTDEVIMQIHNVFRYADPVLRLTTIGAVKLIQFLARMAKEKQISQVEIEDFGKFLKATDGKYDIMNIPATDKEMLREEMDNLGIRFSIMPDLDKEDGLMQLAVYQPDREKFGSWYERFLISRMQGGEKELRELRGLTRGNVSIVSFPLDSMDPNAHPLQFIVFLIPNDNISLFSYIWAYLQPLGSLVGACGI